MASQSLGARIELISNRDIRYEGFLKEVNQEKNTISLVNVRVYGTEGRTGGTNEVPASDMMYEHIVFSGAVIKNIRLFEKNAVTSDPAVVSAQPASMDATRADANRGDYGGSSSSGRGGGAHDSGNTGRGSSNNNSHNNNSGGSSVNIRTNGNAAAAIQHQQQQQQQQQQQSSHHGGTNMPRRGGYGGGGGGGGARSGGGGGGSSNNDRYHRRGGGGGGGGGRYHRNDYGGGRGGGGGSGGSGGGNNNSGGGGASAGGGGGHYRRRVESHTGRDFQPAVGDQKEKFKEDFDFTKSLQELEKKKDEFEKAKESAKLTTKAYNKSSFFDTISCDQKDRARGVRVDREEMKRADAETFGPEMVGSMRSFRRGRGGRGRYSRY